mmetsp:Transcript_55801/g.172972  ORF Transcript_55801/g.172972 Transcript_55801/m.172972 type:complete len:244 (+) Transcript_55801:1594-2325(+)
MRMYYPPVVWLLLEILLFLIHSAIDGLILCPAAFTVCVGTGLPHLVQIFLACLPSLQDLKVLRPAWQATIILAVDVNVPLICVHGAGDYAQHRRVPAWPVGRQRDGLLRKRLPGLRTFERSSVGDPGNELLPAATRLQGKSVFGTTFPYAQDLVRFIVVVAQISRSVLARLRPLLSVLVWIVHAKHDCLVQGGICHLSKAQLVPQHAVLCSQICHLVLLLPLQALKRFRVRGQNLLGTQPVVS